MPLGVVVIVLLVIAWAIVLAPSLHLPKLASSPLEGVRKFEQTMGVLANTRATGQMPGRWVMVPSKARGAVDRRRNRVIRRRRQNFVRLVAASALTLVFGLIPALRALLVAHLVVDVVLVAYVVQLRRWAMALQQKQPQQRRVMRMPEERRISIEMPHVEHGMEQLAASSG
ncbi:MAG TPA: hypothetical protein VM600_08085 [Actinomycetota bacterium]|nr:hypothetical protein [Actinomycetota bacterium]